MARVNSCNGTFSVNNSISSLLVNVTCQNSSAISINITMYSGSRNTIPLIEGTAKHLCYVFYGLVFFLGVFGNIVVFYVVGYRKKKRNSGDIYILSLACADFLASLVAPLIMLNDLITDASVWFYGEALCYVMPAMTPTTLCASAWSLVFISVDRLRLVSFPEFFNRSVYVFNVQPTPRNYKETVISRPLTAGLHRKNLHASIAFIWLSSVSVAIPYSLRSELINGACLSSNNTLVQFKSFVLFVGICLAYSWCMPYFIMMATYYLTARTLKANSFKHENTRAMELRRKQNAKIVKMFVIVVIIFFLLTMPYAVFYFYSCYIIVYASNDVDPRLFFTLNYTLFILASANSCINPLIYAKMHREINGFIRSIICRVIGICCQRCRMMHGDTSVPSSTWSVSTSRTEQSTM